LIFSVFIFKEIKNKNKNMFVYNLKNIFKTENKQIKVFSIFGRSENTMIF